LRRLEQLEREHLVTQQVHHPVLRCSVACYRTHQRGVLVEVALQLHWLEGPSLAEMPPRAAAEQAAFLTAVAGGLAALHQAGYVHGDVKPANILRDGQGRVSLIDFGLTGRIGEPPPRVMGTPATIAPEQLACEPRTVASDTFAFARTVQLLGATNLLPTALLAAALAPRAVLRPPLAALQAALAEWTSRGA
jgi:serine/threonine-protein kinase